MNFTAEHYAILAQFRKHDGGHLSSAVLHGFTNIEPIKISAILADLLAHGLLLRQDSLDAAEWGWQYILSEHGKKFVMEHP